MLDIVYLEEGSDELFTKLSTTITGDFSRDAMSTDNVFINELGDAGSISFGKGFSLRVLGKEINANNNVAVTGRGDR